jgi:hypothetical protein
MDATQFRNACTQARQHLSPEDIEAILVDVFTDPQTGTFDFWPCYDEACTNYPNAHIAGSAACDFGPPTLITNTTKEVTNHG